MKKIILALAFVLISITTYSYQAEAKTTTLNSYEKKLCNSLAEFQSDYLKNPASFKIIKIQKGDYQYNSHWTHGTSWKEDKNTFDLYAKKYKWRITYSATNGFGGTVTDVLYVKADGDFWSPEKLSYEVLYKGKNVTKLSQNKVTAIKNKVKSINYEYY